MKDKLGKIIFLLIGSCITVMAVNFFGFPAEKLFWDIMGTLALIITAGIIMTQSYYTKELAKIGSMPKVAFSLESGKTEKSRKVGRKLEKGHLLRDEDLSVEELLHAQFIIKNLSGFAISFWLEVNLSLEYKNRKEWVNVDTLRFPGTKKDGWILMPGAKVARYSFPAGENILPQALFKKNKGDLIESDKKKLMNKKDEIKNVVALFKISSAPFLKKGLRDVRIELKSLEWKFNLEEMVWTDPQGARDYNIQF